MYMMCVVIAFSSKSISFGGSRDYKTHFFNQILKHTRKNFKQVYKKAIDPSFVTRTPFCYFLVYIFIITVYYTYFTVIRGTPSKLEVVRDDPEYYWSGQRVYEVEINEVFKVHIYNVWSYIILVILTNNKVETIMMSRLKAEKCCNKNDESR